MRQRLDFRQLFELQPVPSWLIDDSGRMLLANAQARALLGGIDCRLDLPVDPWRLLSLLSPRDRLRLRGALSETGPPAPIRLDELWLEGQVQGWQRLAGLVLRLDPGQTGADLRRRGQRFLLQLLPMPDQQLPANAVQDGAGPDRLRDPLMSETVFLNSNDAIVVTDAQGRLRRVNPSFERLTGFSAAAWPGRFTELLQPAGAARPAGPAGPGEAGAGELEVEILAALGRRGCWSGEALLRTASAGERLVRLSLTALADSDGGAQGYMAIIGDLTESRRASDEILRLATTDSLTGLPNRRYFFQRLDALIAASAGNGAAFALAIFDLDRFKPINDTYGHVAGDSVLREVAKVLRGRVRGDDIAARIGGEEFAVLCPNCPPSFAMAVAERARTAIEAQPIELPDQGAIDVTVSVGGAFAMPWVKSVLTEWMSRADQQLYRAKREGRNCVRLEPVLSADVSAEEKGLLFGWSGTEGQFADHGQGT